LQVEEGRREQGQLGKAWQVRCEKSAFKGHCWGWGQGGEMNQALYAHMNNKRKMKKKKAA
jgi:hypothetical protein